MIQLAQPIWLLLAIPLAATLWLWPPPSRLLLIWRAVVLGLIVLAMTAPRAKLPSRNGTVIVLADRSLSMPDDAAAQQLEMLELIHKGMAGEDRLGLVCFGQRAVVERAADVGPISGFAGDVEPDGSNLAAAVQKALSLLPEEGPSRLIVLSDGRWTGENPAAIAGVAASRGTAIDYRHLSRAAAGDVGIERLDAPQRVSPGESFMIGAWVRLPAPQRVNYELLRNGARIASGTRDLSSGVSRLLFRDVAGDPGTRRYTLLVAADGSDPVPENNIAKALVGVDGPRPILYLTQTGAGATGLPALLKVGGLTVHATPPGDVEWSLDTLSGYAAVVLENVPAETLTQPGMATLARWVEQSGAGLLMTGGRQSFGPGGYFKSPLEAILPVSMELRQEHRKFSVAIAVALDRSGSMAMPAAGGKTKMDLANLGTAQVVDLLSPMDELGVIAVDSSPHVIVPMQPVDDAAATRNRVLRIQSMGGGIFIYEALQSASAMVSTATPQTRHIILFADAMDSEEPGAYRSLVDKLAAAGVTVSVIGLGTEKDVDANLLKDIAARGNGRVYFTTDPHELPRLFAQDTFVVARSSFIDELTPVQTTSGLVALTGRPFPNPPAVGGYNLCYLQPGANLAAVTVDEYNAPLVATWQAGIGRTACYTGEVDGQFTGPIARWRDFGDLLTSLTRWTAGNDAPLPHDMVVRQRVESGVYHVELHLDPRRSEMDLPALPTVNMLHGRVGETPASERLLMHWTTPDMLSVAMPLRSDETALATLDLPGPAGGSHTLSPVCLPYSPEFEPPRPDQGETTLEQLARATGGKQRIDLAGVWNDLVRQPRFMPVTHWLLIAAAVLLLLEVLERRTGALSSLTPARSRRRVGAKAASPAGASGLPPSKSQAKSQTPRPQPASSASADAPQPDASAPAPPPAAGMADALRQASRRAGRRTDKPS